MVHINFLSPSLKVKRVEETYGILLKARKGAKTQRLGNSLNASLRLCVKFCMFLINCLLRSVLLVLLRINGKFEFVIQLDSAQGKNLKEVML